VSLALTNAKAAVSLGAPRMTGDGSQVKPTNAGCREREEPIR
jgi:hypothetical protein